MGIVAGLLGGCDFVPLELAPRPARITIEVFLSDPDSYTALGFVWSGSKTSSGSSSEPTYVHGTVPTPTPLPDVVEPYGHYRLTQATQLAYGTWTFSVSILDGTQPKFHFTCTGQEIFYNEPSLLVVATREAAGATTSESTNCTSDLGATVTGVVPNHDLAVIDVAAPAGPVAGQAYTVSVAVENRSDAASDTARVSLTDNGAAAGSAAPATIGPLGSQTFGLPWTPATAGPHTLVATADPIASEYDYANNTASVTVDVQSATACPVVGGNTPASITTTTTVTVTGTGFTAGSTVAVTGAGASPPTVTAVTFQSPTTLDVRVQVVALTSRGTYQFVVTNDPGGPNQCVSPPGGSLTY